MATHLACDRVGPSLLLEAGERAFARRALLAARKVLAQRILRKRPAFGEHEATEISGLYFAVPGTREFNFSE